jgi:hypothetical protein
MTKKKSFLETDVGVRKAIIGALQQGLSQADACLLAGVSKETVRLWIHKGTDPGSREPYRSFAKEFATARSTGKLAKIRKIERDDDWKAAAWLLERQFPDEFGKGETKEVRIGNFPGEKLMIESEVAVDLAKLSVDQRRALEGIIATLDAMDDEEDQEA